MAIRNIVKIGDDILRKVCRTQQQQNTQEDFFHHK